MSIRPAVQAELTFKNAQGRTARRGRRRLVVTGQVLDRAAVLLAFEQVGGSDRALEMAQETTRWTRYCLRPADRSFQAIKHKLADMYVNSELARSNAYYGAWALSSLRRKPTLL